jgi:hypothetical protein
MIAKAAFVSLILFSSVAAVDASDVERGQIISDHHLACKQRGDAEVMVHFTPTPDIPAFKEYVLDRLLNRMCIVLAKGTEVTISHRAGPGETIAVRPTGETEFLFIDKYDVEADQ